MPKKVIMPKFGMDQEEGTVAAWLRQDGDAVEKGEPILEVETDKVNMEVEAPASGTLAGIRIGPGVTVPIGEVIAYILKPGETLPDSPQPNRPITQSPNPPTPPAARRLTPVAERMADQFGVDPTAIQSNGGRITKEDVERHIADLLAGQPPSTDSGGRGEAVRAVPAARRLARELGVDLADISGSGPGGRIQSRDVQAIAQSPITQSPIAQSPIANRPINPTPVRRTVPLTGMRRTIAQRLTASVQQIPQFTASVDVNMERATRIIADIRSAPGADDGPKVTVTALLVKACAWALARHPGVNASWQEENGKAEIVEWGEINVGVAVALDAGLIVPVIRHADRRSLAEIAGDLADLAGRAKTGKLTPNELAGGTFTISNLGMVGVDRFTAIINPPQAAILAVGRTVPRPVVDQRGQIVVQPQADFTLTADHRLIDGALAGRFLADLRGALEFPGRML